MRVVRPRASLLVCVLAVWMCGPASWSASAATGAIAQVDASIVDAIEAFGFDSAMAMGVGGFLTTRIYPVVLFKDGTALTDAEGLAFPGGLAQHRRAHPEDWTRWRRDGASIQLDVKGKWDTLAFPTTYPRLPDDFRLDGLFRALSGAGTLAVGGAQEVTAWREYRFFPDGRVQRGGGAGGRSEVSGGSTATSATAPNQRGTYRVSGLQVVITWGDGATERRVLITDPTDPKASIWLDGVGYARRTPR